MPPAAHTHRLSPTDPVSCNTPLGDMNIPEPVLTIKIILKIQTGTVLNYE